MDKQDDDKDKDKDINQDFKPNSGKKKSTAPPQRSTVSPKKRKIFNVNSSKNLNKAIVIASSIERPKNEEEQEEEEEEEKEVEGGNLDPYKTVLGKTKNSNMKELNDMKCKFIKDNKILNLDGKMYYMLHKGAEKNFKNYDEKAREPKRNFYEWTRDCDGLPRINALKSEAVEPATVICSIIADIMFLMSQNKPKEMEAKLQAFEDSLGCVSKDEQTLVIWRFIDFIRIADRKIRMVRDRDQLAPRGKEILIETEVGGDDDEYLQESFIDPILFLLLQEILRLEIFWGYRRFSCSRNEIIAAIPSLEDELVSFELSLTDVRDEINNAAEKDLFGEVSFDWEVGGDYLELELKINEMFDDLDN